MLRKRDKSRKRGAVEFRGGRLHKLKRLIKEKKLGLNKDEEVYLRACGREERWFRLKIAIFVFLSASVFFVFYQYQRIQDKKVQQVHKAVADLLNLEQGLWPGKPGQ